MNYYQAQNILDEVREGANYSIQMISKALELTGDLEPRELEEQRGPRMDQALQEQSERSGDARCPALVAKNVIRYSQDTWAIGG